MPLSFILVLVTGLEPVRVLPQGILSPWCLPIPPHQHIGLQLILPHFLPAVKQGNRVIFAAIATYKLPSPSSDRWNIRKSYGNF